MTMTIWLWLYVSLIYYMTIMTMTTYPNGVFRVTPMGVFGGIWGYTNGSVLRNVNGVFVGTPWSVWRYPNGAVWRNSNGVLAILGFLRVSLTVWLWLPNMTTWLWIHNYDHITICLFSSSSPSSSATSPGPLFSSSFPCPPLLLFLFSYSLVVM
jgi:hypothetical protein